MTVRAGVFVAFVALGAIAACKAGVLSDGSGACSTGACEGGAVADSAVACFAPPVPDGGFLPYQSLASGDVTGGSVNAGFCNALVEMSHLTYGAPGVVLFSVDSTTAFASGKVRLPAGAVAGTLTATLGMQTPTVGVYSSSDPKACGTLAFSYGIDTVPGLDCSAEAGAYSCAKGCSYTYFCGADAAAAPCCVPLATTFLYQASAATSCTPRGTQASQPALGSWTLTFTSVAKFEGDAGPYFGDEELYLVHGTLTANLVGTADTTDSANLSLSF